MTRLALAALLALAGCAGPFEPPEEWAEFNPPPQYRAWHAEVQTCVGARRSFDEITWRLVRARTFHCDDMDNAIGCLAYPGTIYLVERALNAAPVVKAELVHYVRQLDDHDAMFTRCRWAVSGRQ